MSWHDTIQVTSQMSWITQDNSQLAGKRVSHSKACWIFIEQTQERSASIFSHACPSRKSLERKGNSN